MRLILPTSYYKIKIVSTFSLISAALVILMTWLSYNFVREIYLDQASANLRTLSKITAQQIDKTYLDFLSYGSPSESIKNYFTITFNKYQTANPNSELFIFNSELKVILHSNNSSLEGESNSQLLINRNEILGLEVNQSAVSLPFKGDDNKWYLWGFFKLNEENWLAIRENATKLSKIDDLAKIFILIGFCGVALTFAIGLFVAKSITKPLNKLVKFSSEIGKGNLNADPPRDMHGEIKRLLIEMDQMRKNLFRHQKEKEDILAQIAHEIRNPLGGIELLASLIREDLQRDNRDTRYIDKILGEVNDLKSLITAYLNFSRPEPPKQENVNIASLISELKQFIKNKLDEKNINLSEELTVKEIKFDPFHLKMILLNLISNSIDAISINGSIQITSSNSNGQLQISITDDGVSISDENLKNIFKPFFTTKKDGTGLGLAISQKLCRENNADLLLQKNSSIGCTFTIIKKN